MNPFSVSTKFVIICIIGLLDFLISCDQGNPCDDISISARVTDSECDQSIGSIEVSTTGGQAPIQYKLDNGAFQASTTFSQIKGGVYDVFVRDGQGCEEEEEVIVSNGLTYTNDIKSIIQMNCAIQNCHVAGQNRTDFTIDDNAVSRSFRIKEQASSRNMPPSSSGLALSQEDIDKIVCWADGGGPK